MRLAVGYVRPETAESAMSVGTVAIPLKGNSAIAMPALSTPIAKSQ
jgi:hypothetical protein